MKILFTYTGFLPAVAWGGPVSVIHQNALELKKRGHTITVCASNLLDKHSRIGTGSFEKDIDGIRVVYLNTYLFSNWPGSLGPTFLSLPAWRWLRQEVAKADVIHVNGFRNIFALMSTFFAGQLGKPVVMQPHGGFPHIVNSIQLKKWFDKLFVKPLFKNVNFFVALQPIEKQQIITAGGRSDRIEIVANGLGLLPKVRAAYKGLFKRRFDIAAEEEIILFLGRINRKKGTDILVEAFAKIPDIIRQKSRLVIAGPDDGQLNEVQEMVTQYGLTDKVIFTGLLSGDDVHAAYIDADLFVLPCRTDTFPMAILEACRSGTPMVITETCEIADMLAQKVATIVPVNPESIALAMTDLLENKELQEQYRENCQALMQSVFSIEAVGDKLEAIYSKAIQAKQ